MQQSNASISNYDSVQQNSVQFLDQHTYNSQVATTNITVGLAQTRTSSRQGARLGSGN